MRKKFLSVFLLVVIFLLSGCGKGENPTDGTPLTGTEALEKEEVVTGLPVTNTAKKPLTLDAVKELSKKGEELSWEDFEGYDFIETGSGLYIRVYDVEGKYSLIIGGSWIAEKPYYVCLRGIDTPYIDVDIRYGDIDGFLKKLESPKDFIKDEAKALDKESALKKGYFVIDEDELYGGETSWQIFLERVGGGGGAEMTVAHFIGDDAYLDLLRYDEEKYTLHEYSDEAGYSSSEYKYMRPLLGTENGKSVVFFVLTDSLILTYNDVRQSFISSDLDSITKIPFKWLGFTTYAKNSKESARQLIEKDIRLMAEEIAKNGGVQSNPYSYTEKSPEQYKALCAGGGEAVEYIRDIIENSSDDGLVEYILASAASDILGETEKTWSSGKDWLKKQK